MPLDHVGLWVPGAQLQRTLDFYSAALSPIGYRILLRPVPHAAGFGRDAPDFWIAGKEGEDKGVGGVHVAFSTMSRADVDAFHAAALEAGGKDNGAPGLRPQYHKAYYGAFVLDPAGNNVEVVCHCPEGEE